MGALRGTTLRRLRTSSARGREWVIHRTISHNLRVRHLTPQRNSSRYGAYKLSAARVSSGMRCHTARQLPLTLAACVARPPPPPNSRLPVVTSGPTPYLCPPEQGDPHDLGLVRQVGDRNYVSSKRKRTRSFCVGRSTGSGEHARGRTAGAVAAAIFCHR